MDKPGKPTAKAAKDVAAAGARTPLAPEGQKRRRILWLASVLPLGLFALLAAIFFLRLATPPPAREAALVGKPAPDWRMDALFSDGTGGPDPDALRGEPYLINAFASWCVPCRAEHPVLETLARDAKLPIVGFAWKDDPAAARAFLKELGNPYVQVGVDPSGKTGVELGLLGVPESWLVDHEGTVIWKHTGPVMPDIATRELVPRWRAARRAARRASGNANGSDTAGAQ